MSRSTAMLVAVIVFGVAGCQDISSEHDEDPIIALPEKSVGLEQRFEVGLGERVVLENTGTEVTFSAVTHDYRCPSDVQCIQAGEAGIVLTVTDSLGNDSQVFITIPGLILTPYRADDATRHGNRNFRLMRLNPYPNTGQDQSVQDYRALMMIESVLDDRGV